MDIRKIYFSLMFLAISMSGSGCLYAEHDLSRSDIARSVMETLLRFRTESKQALERVLVLGQDEDGAVGNQLRTLAPSAEITFGEDALWQPANVQSSMVNQKKYDVLILAFSLSSVNVQRLAAILNQSGTHLNSGGCLLFVNGYTEIIEHLRICWPRCLPMPDAMKKSKLLFDASDWGKRGFDQSLFWCPPHGYSEALICICIKR